MKDIIKKVDTSTKLTKKQKETFDELTSCIRELAILEHEGWARNKEENIWTQNVRNDDRKWHNCICPYNDLADGDKYKDIDAICNIQDILESVGIYIKKL